MEYIYNKSKNCNVNFEPGFIQHSDIGSGEERNVTNSEIHFFLYINLFLFI